MVEVAMLIIDEFNNPIHLYVNDYVFSPRSESQRQTSPFSHFIKIYPARRGSFVVYQSFSVLIISFIS